MNPPILSFSCPNETFIDICEEIGTSDLQLPNQNHVRFFCFNIDSCEFDYSELNNCLRDNIAYYVFSRLKMEKYETEKRLTAAGIDAIEFLKDATNPKDCGAGGELGEFLLYLFLENMLKAPKILTKVELKSSSEMYVHGWDGVHLYYNQDSSSYQLIYGESKIYKSISKALTEAMNSIENLKLTNDKDLILIDSQIFTESIRKEDAELIRNLIIPSKNKKANLPFIDKAFGIFLGYTFECKEKNNIECRSKIKQKIKKDIENEIPKIKMKIEELGLTNHSFYFYILPFNDAMKDRRTIINKLMVRGGK